MCDVQVPIQYSVLYTIYYICLAYNIDDLNTWNVEMPIITFNPRFISSNSTLMKTFQWILNICRVHCVTFKAFSWRNTWACLMIEAIWVVYHESNKYISCC